jgi:hypothetical protein
MYTFGISVINAIIATMRVYIMELLTHTEKIVECNEKLLFFVFRMSMSFSDAIHAFVAEY